MADDEVTDLTEDEAASEAAPKGKKEKAQKAPKGEKEPKAPKDKKEKKEKEKGGNATGLIIIMILVLLILIGGFGALLYFDMFDARMIVADVVRDPMLDVIVWLDPRFSSVNQRLIEEAEAQEKRIAELHEALDRREEEIALLEGVLQTKEDQLERRANELNIREEQILAMYERTVPLYRREMTEEELEDMLQISTLYTQMAPEAAAARLVRLYDPRDVAAILYFMGERNAAAIMSVMTVEYAAEITEILLYS